MAGSVFLRDGENKCDEDGRRTVCVTVLILIRTAGLQVSTAAETPKQRQI